MNAKDLQSFVRSNGYAWPGGYPCALLMADGEVIDAQSTRENYCAVRRALRDSSKGNASAEDWTPVEVFVHWEGEPMQCAHSGRMIESAYGVPEA